MSKAQAAYTLLILLSVVDGTIDDSERLVIRLYIKQAYQEDIDFAAVEQSLSQLTEAELLRQFQQAAVEFYNASTTSERVGLLLTGLEVVWADGVMKDEETAIFRGLSDTWGLRYEAIAEHFKEEHSRLIAS
jgi:uncharacterized tellurite resistance protein B-like protein